LLTYKNDMNVASVAAHFARIRLQIGRPVTIGGSRFKSKGYFSNRLALETSHEPHLTSVYQRILTAHKGAVVDIGANLGQTLAKVLAVDPSRTYVGFEPQIACCFFVDQFLKDNALSNCKILPVALSDTNGIGIIHSADPYDVMASLRDQHACTHEYRHRSFVPLRKGDDILDELGVKEIALIKIDVEGLELPVLKGLRHRLDAQKPVLVFEVLPNFEGTERTMLSEAKRKEASANADRIYHFLTKLGYQVWQIDQHGAECPIDRFNLDDPEHVFGSDYLARPAHSDALRPGREHNDSAVAA
jgi:FkbM family methyltransferase